MSGTSDPRDVAAQNAARDQIFGVPSSTPATATVAPIAPQDSFSVLINGMIYAGFTEATFETAIDKMACGVELSVSEKWAGQDQPWQIQRFDLAVVKIGKDTVLTGFVYGITPRFDADAHSVGISICSMTQNLVDCSPDIPSGQYRGYTLEAIARSVCGLFTIGVVVQADCSQVFADATLQRAETAFTFLERLGRLAGVLLTDNGLGNLVLTTAGTTRASGKLVQGQNMLSGSAKLSAEKRFSQYIVKGQRALGSTQPSYNWSGSGDDDAPAPTPVQTQVYAEADDPLVPFYRPHVSIAEAQLDDAGMQRRANWERNYAFGRSTEATIGVQGFRQPDGALWTENQLVTVTSPFLQLDQDLLVAGLRMRESIEQGRTTELRVGPIEGYTPDPGQVKLHAKKGRKGTTGSDWSQAGGV